MLCLYKSELQETKAWIMMQGLKEKKENLLIRKFYVSSFWMY